MTEQTLEFSVQEQEKFKEGFLRHWPNTPKEVLENDHLWAKLLESHQKWEDDFTEWLRNWKDISDFLENNRTFFWNFLTYVGIFTREELTLVHKGPCGRRFTNVMGQVANGLL